MASILPNQLNRHPDVFTKTDFTSYPLGLQDERLDIYINFIKSVDASGYYKSFRYAISKSIKATTKQRPINQKA